jgi:hypothetical protein
MQAMARTFCRRQHAFGGRRNTTVNIRSTKMMKKFFALLHCGTGAAKPTHIMGLARHPRIRPENCAP